MVMIGTATGCVSSPRPVLRAPLGRAEQTARDTGFTMLGLDESGVPDEIDMIPIDEHRQLREIVVIVERGAAKLRDVEVNLDGGGAFVAHTRPIFAADSASRIIEIPHGPRSIDRVHVSYVPLNSRMDPVRVEVWGR